MKIYLSVPLLFIFTCNSAIAQIGYGPELGLGMSTYKFAPSATPIDYTSASVNTIFSGKIGVIIDEPLNKHIYFQAGVFLSRKGAERSFSYYKNDSFHEAVHQTLDVNYIEVPLSVIFKTAKQGKGRFMFGLGATPSYIVGGQNHLQDIGKYNDSSINSNGTYKISIGNTLHAFDIGVNVVAGYELPTGLFFRVYYTGGVNDIGIRSEVDKNRMFGISAGYLFGKGRNINKEAESLIDKGD